MTPLPAPATPQSGPILSDTPATPPRTRTRAQRRCPGRATAEAWAGSSAEAIRDARRAALRAFVDGLDERWPDGWAAEAIAAEDAVAQAARLRREAVLSRARGADERRAS